MAGVHRWAWVCMGRARAAPCQQRGMRATCMRGPSPASPVANLAPRWQRFACWRSAQAADGSAGSGSLGWAGPGQAAAAVGCRCYFHLGGQRRTFLHLLPGAPLAKHLAEVPLKRLGTGRGPRGARQRHPCCPPVSGEQRPGWPAPRAASARQRAPPPAPPDSSPCWQETDRPTCDSVQGCVSVANSRRQARLGHHRA